MYHIDCAIFDHRHGLTLLREDNRKRTYQGRLDHIAGLVVAIQRRVYSGQWWCLPTEHGWSAQPVR